MQRFFRDSAYYMYCLIPEEPLRLVYGTFYLAIGNVVLHFVIIQRTISTPHDYKIYTPFYPAAF